MASRRAPAWTLLSVFTVLTASAALSQPTLPPANDRIADLEQRVRELEQLVRELRGRDAVPVGPKNVEQGLSSLPAPADVSRASLQQPTPLVTRDNPPSAQGKVAGWDNGFFLQSPDRAHVLRLTGQIQADYRNFLDGRDTADVDGFLARRVRFGLEATVARYFEFRLLPDFGQGRTVIQDAYLNVRYWDEFQIVAGKFKQPFSYEQLIQDRFVPTLERSIIDQLAPARDVGVMLHGQKLFGDRIDYAVAYSNGERDGDLEVNNTQDVVGRVAWRPFRSLDQEALLYHFQLGISATFGAEREPAAPVRLRTPATVQWFQFNPAVTADGQRFRYTPEAALFFRSCGIMGQYFRQDQQFRPTAASNLLINVPFDGYQVLASWLVTGEHRTSYSQAITPRVDFDLRHPLQCHGAFELVARLSRLSLGNEVFASGPGRLADPTRNSNAATEMTLGFNWYWNRWVRWQFNWERAWFDDSVRLGAGSLRQQDSLLARFQVIF